VQEVRYNFYQRSKTRSDSLDCQARNSITNPITAATMTEDTNLNPWFEAKRLLIDDYKNGYILNDMDADQVHR
jgi:hypothetical protein